jgi:hypothetical protein
MSEQSHLQNLLVQSSMLAKLVGEGQLKLAVPISSGDDAALSSLKENKKSVDYIIRTQEMSG